MFCRMSSKIPTSLVSIIGSFPNVFVCRRHGRSWYKKFSNISRLSHIIWARLSEACLRCWLTWTAPGNSRGISSWLPSAPTLSPKLAALLTPCVCVCPLQVGGDGGAVQEGEGGGQRTPAPTEAGQYPLPFSLCHKETALLKVMWTVGSLPLITTSTRYLVFLVPSFCCQNLTRGFLLAPILGDF